MQELVKFRRFNQDRDEKGLFRSTVRYYRGNQGHVLAVMRIFDGPENLQGFRVIAPETATTPAKTIPFFQVKTWGAMEKILDQTCPK